MPPSAADPGPPASPPVPLLVLGATSLVGGYLLQRLAAERRPALAVSRRAPDRPGWVRADLTDPNALDRLGPVQAAISLMPLWGLVPVLPGLAASGLRRLVAFSSTSRFTKQGSGHAGERAVAQALAEAEDRVAALCATSGVALTVLRPTLIYAEGRDGNISRLARLIDRFGVVPLAGQGQGLRQPVHADDLAGAALAVLASPATAGRSYDLAGGETLTYRAMVGRLFQALGRPERILSLPPPVWRAALVLARPWLTGATGDMGARMSADLVFDDQAARADFGWSPRPFRPRFGRDEG